eukprot:5626161-Prymnesium_polylepis.1
MFFSSEKTRSHAAELGVRPKVMRAASAHDGNDLPLMRHQLRMASVKLSTSDVSKAGASFAAVRNRGSSCLSFGIRPCDMRGVMTAISSTNAGFRWLDAKL